jgi:hypothetical protein
MGCMFMSHHTRSFAVLQVDRLIQSLSVGLGMSTSGWVWNNMHNKHHATPSKVWQTCHAT